MFISVAKSRFYVLSKLYFNLGSASLYMEALLQIRIVSLQICDIIPWIRIGFSSEIVTEAKLLSAEVSGIDVPSDVDYNKDWILIHSQ